MKLVGQHVQAWCDRCGAYVTFESTSSGNFFGLLPWYRLAERDCRMALLLRCAACNRPGMVELTNWRADLNWDEVGIAEMHPAALPPMPLPAEAPEGVKAEFREAERCASAQAWRAGTAMLRSVLEKTLTANGYRNGNLKQKIDNAAEEGLITSARRGRAHEDIRSLGNEVVHDEWREVSMDEFLTARDYAQRIVEDFYEHRSAVVEVLVSKGRVAADQAGECAEA